MSLFVPAALIITSFLGASGASAQDPKCPYTAASLQGSYALIGYYAGGIELALAVETIDGEGKMVRTATVNQPLAGSTTGERTRTKTMSTGNYTVNCEGTGTLRRMQTNATTGVTSTNESDIIITGAVVKDGQFIATALVSAQSTPSTIVPSGVFTSMVYTRLPDLPAATPRLQRRRDVENRVSLHERDFALGASGMLVACQSGRRSQQHTAQGLVDFNSTHIQVLAPQRIKG